MTVELFAGSGSPYSWRVQLALEIKGIPYVLHMLSFSERHHKLPEYLALNPRGKVPTLKVGDFVLTESVAIVGYIDARWPEPPLYGHGAEERGRVLESVAQTVSYIEPVAPRIYRPIFRGGPAEEAEAVAGAGEELAVELRRVEAALGRTGWLVGKTISAADVVLYPVIQLLLRAASRPAAASYHTGLEGLAERYPRIEMWNRQIELIPGFDRTWPPHWRQG